ncbi:class I SAM-dependent DNA methyltransferase [Bacillus salitolerans]|uniref:Class I SAM-dependent DNA methyltransferase n=1 Tax=Bacillus salitolerans TaxID=1437434 RepID=A0ABW4LQJ1_9BACI
MVFNQYAELYNAFYEDKNYQSEVDFVHMLIKRYCPGASKIVEFGCGTGKHAELLAHKGYSILGIDQSKEMVAIANEKIGNTSMKNKVMFNHGDIRNFNCDQKYEVALSLFHVISYLNTNEDLLNALYTINNSLVDGGVFIFDCWYGPAVLSIQPETRVKRVSINNKKILRVAEPKLLTRENVVEVNYEFIIEDSEHLYSSFNEVHTMRYMFFNELEFYLKISGFKLLHSCEFITNNELSSDTWNSCFVAIKG